MPKLTEREQRTIRRAAIGLVLYLVLFYGVQASKWLGARRAEFRQLVRVAESLKQEVSPYSAKVERAEKLMAGFRMDPAKLDKNSVVADASAALQQAATGGGLQLGPIRESPTRASAKELASMQLEGTGPIAASLTFLQRLESLGFPLIVDAVQITADPAKPGMIKLNLTIVVLDYEQWKPREARRA
jgi:hypothetical protein